MRPADEQLIEAVMQMLAVRIRGVFVALRQG